MDYQKNGFVQYDSAPPYFSLMALKFNKKAPDPKFKKNAVAQKPESAKGVVIYFTDQCPFFRVYAGIMADHAKKKGIKAKLVEVKSAKEAQDGPSPYGTFGVFYDGKFIEHSPMSEKGLDKILKLL